MTKVLIVDDQQLFREGLSTLLSVHQTITVVGEAENGREAIEQARRLKPDVILMDLRMPVLGGVAAIKEIQKEEAPPRIIVLTTFDDDESIFDALKAGAIGYLLKDVSSEKLVEAIETAARGDSFLQPSIATKVLAELNRRTGESAQQSAGEHPLIEPLSKRELEILQHIGQGQSNKEIAGQLYLTEGTVKNHVTNILGKMGVRDRTQAALKGKTLGLI
ncbi:MAG: response regulator transcription factor [Chloroflexota bacterium]